MKRYAESRSLVAKIESVARGLKNDKSRASWKQVRRLGKIFRRLLERDTHD
jgi:hypothetical protein